MNRKIVWSSLAVACILGVSGLTYYSVNSTHRVYADTNPGTSATTNSASPSTSYNTLSQFQASDSILRDPVLGKSANDQAAFQKVFQGDASAITSVQVPSLSTTTSSSATAQITERKLPASLSDELDIPTPNSATINAMHFANVQAALHSNTYIQDQLTKHMTKVLVKGFSVNGHQYNVTFHSTSGQVKQTSLGQTIVATADGQLTTPSGSTYPVETLIIDVVGTDNIQESMTIENAGWPISLAFGKPFLTQSVWKEIFGSSTTSTGSSANSNTSTNN